MNVKELLILGSKLEDLTESIVLLEREIKDSLTGEDLAVYTSFLSVKTGLKPVNLKNVVDSEGDLPNFVRKTSAYALKVPEEIAVKMYMVLLEYYRTEKDKTLTRIKELTYA